MESNKLLDGYKRNKPETDVRQRTSVVKSVAIIIGFSILTFILMMVGHFAIGIMTGVVLVLNGLDLTVLTPFQKMMLNLVVSFGGMALIFMLSAKIYTGKVKSLGFYKGNILKKYFKGFAIGLLMMAASVLICWMTGSMKMVSEVRGQVIGIGALSTVLLVAVGWIVQGATEEIITRGWLMPIVAQKSNVIIAIVVSSSFFGFLHLGNNNVGILPMINLIMFGVFAAFYALDEESLWGVCGIHSAWNWAQGNIFGIAVSGSEFEGGTLTKFLPTGTLEQLSGGPFGIEGGLVCTAILVIGVVVVIKTSKKKLI